jgi:hypothetical protein
LGVKGTCASIVSEFVPTVIDELDGREGVVYGEVLGDIVSAVRFIPLDRSFYVGGEVVVGSTGDWGGLVVRGEGDL